MKTSKRNYPTGPGGSGQMKVRVDKEFMTPDGRKLRSRKAVVEFMKLMGTYTEIELKKAEAK